MRVLNRLLGCLGALVLLLAQPAAARNAGVVPLPERGVVSAADPRAADAGARILRAGGSATDAAIATMLALGVVEPQSSGIGGGGFLLLAERDGAMTSYDGRETAPAGAGPDWFMQNGAPLDFDRARISGLSIGIPGNLRLAAMAHAAHGKLAWKALFTPAIALARDGFRITPRLFEFLASNASTGAHDPAGRALFYGTDGAPLPVGTLVRNPQLAQTLEAIARKGPDRFYKGRSATALAQRATSETPRKTPISTADIAAYRAKERPVVCGFYRAYRICGMGPPSSGATTVIAILKQMERFDLKALGSQSPVAWHLFAESQRLAYADRDLYLGDSDFVTVPVAGLVDPGYLSARGALISPAATMAQAPAGVPPGLSAPVAMGSGPPENGTTHFVAIDRKGEVASYTSTVEGPFGSGLMVGGFYLNNELTDFSFVPEKDGKPVANRVEGGKRPRSSMAPTLVYAPDGHLVLALGAAGGATIPVQVARTIIGVIDWGLDARRAIALPVLFSPGDTVIIEPGSMLEAMAPELARLGHSRIVTRAMPLKTNAIQWNGSTWIGAADPRSEGAPASE